jgi:LuxR family maltose regulon positive regulatory protein
MSTILTTKLHIPPLRSGHVSRPRLVARLNPGLGPRITLVSAPAGYGKTTLVVEWLAHSQSPAPKVAWLSLDEDDNDPVRLLSHLIAAMRRVNQSLGETTLSLLQAPQPAPPETIITALINDIAPLPDPFILVLDDYHVMHELGIHRQLGVLVEHQPPQVHLVILTREDPPLPLARLRTRGQMVEIRLEDLRFLLEECTDFLNRAMGPEVAPADVAALEHRTEGWIAGLQLAGVSMQEGDDLPGFIQAFTGSRRSVLDYLIGEVLAHHPAEVRDFLLKTSSLGRLTARLCDAVTGQPDRQGILQMLDQSNLFVVPLDQSRSWCRHHLAFLAAFAGPAKDSVSQPQVERRSESELQILRLLAGGLSNQEIAKRLVISVGTTESHVHHILGKAGGDSRLQAVARARQLGLP